MTRPRIPPLLDALRQAWSTYRRSTRPMWRFIGDSERRFLRTLNRNAFDLEQRQITQRKASTWAAFVADVNKLTKRRGSIEVVGWGPTRLPICALVRVPNANGFVDEYVVGEPRDGDARAIERLAALARPSAAQLARTDVWYAKMVKALGEAREKVALKAYALDERRKHARETAEWQRWARASYLAHGRADRCMRRAIAYKNKLAAAGLVYDLTQIDTPVTIPEEGHDGVHQAASKAATAARPRAG